MDILLKEWESTIQKSTPRLLSKLQLPEGVFETSNPQFVVKCQTREVTKKGEPGTSNAMIPDEKIREFCDMLDFNALQMVDETQLGDACKILTEGLWEHVQVDTSKPKVQIVKKTKKMKPSNLPSTVDISIINEAINQKIQYSSEEAIQRRRDTRVTRSNIKKNIEQIMESGEHVSDNWMVRHKEIPRKQWPGKKKITNIMKNVITVASPDEAYSILSEFITNYYYEPKSRLDITHRRETKNDKIKRLELENQQLKLQIQELLSAGADSSVLDSGAGADSSALGSGAGDGAGADSSTLGSGADSSTLDSGAGLT